TNLLGNAVKFTQQGHILTRVVGMQSPDSKETSVHITVEDTGIGIPAEKVADIFGEFNQVEEESSRQFEGTGLGLAICERLIRMMGGTIWVESEVDIGSSFGFQVTLPSADQSAVE